MLLKGIKSSVIEIEIEKYLLFKCRTCNSRFNDKSILDRHRKIHHGGAANLQDFNHDLPEDDDELN